MARNKQREELESVAHQLGLVVVDDLDEDGEEGVPHLSHALLVGAGVLQRQGSRLEEEVNVVWTLIVFVGCRVLDELL